MSGLHIIGPIGPHLETIRTAYGHGMRVFVHVKPEPGDGPRLRAATGPDAFLVFRFAGGPGTGVSDSEIQQRYEADPVAAAHHLWNTYYAPHLHAAGISSYNCCIWNNEPGLGNGDERRFRLQRLVEFSRAAMNICEANQIGMAYFAFSMGVPELDEWTQLYPFLQEVMGRNNRLAPENRHYLDLHEYGSWGATGPGSLFHEENWYLFRYELQVWPRLPESLKALPYFIGETGPDHPGGWQVAYGTSWPALAIDMLTYTTRLAAMKRPCRGWAMFTVNQEGGFASFDMKGTPLLQTLVTQRYPSTMSETQAPPTPPNSGYSEVWSNHWSERLGNLPRYIVLHSSVSPVGSDFDDTVAYLKQNDRGVSTHVLVGYGRTVRMVPDNKAAHTAESPTSQLPDGTPNYLTNERTLNIEMFQQSGQTTPPDHVRLSMPVVVAWIRTWRLPLAAIVSHQSIDPTRRADPVGVDIIQYRAAIQSLLYDGETPPEGLLEATKDAQEMSYNTTAALTRAALSAGYTTALSPEVRRPAPQGRETVSQLWVRLTDGREAVFWTFWNEWQNVRRSEL